MPGLLDRLGAATTPLAAGCRRHRTIAQAAIATPSGTLVRRTSSTSSGLRWTWLGSLSDEPLPVEVRTLASKDRAALDRLLANPWRLAPTEQTLGWAAPA